MGRNWELRATAWPENEFSAGIAEAANADPHRYWTKRGAENAVRFYTMKLGLPVTFAIVHRRAEVE